MSTYRSIVTAALLASVLFGCSNQDDSPVLRLGTNVWPGYEPLYLARELGKIDSKEVRLIEYPSASEVLRAFRNKTLEAASLTLDEVIQLRQDNIPITIVLVHDISHGGDVILANPMISNIKSLAGKKVAVEGNALGAYVLTRALEIHGMALHDINLHSSDVNMHERLYIEKKVDAVVTFEPVRTKLLKHGAREIFTSREIPNEIVDVLVVHNNYLEQHPARIKKLVDIWFDTIDYFEKNTQESASIISRRLKISPVEVVAGYDGLQMPTREENVRLLRKSDGDLIVTLKNLGRVLEENNLVGKNVVIDGLITEEFL